jgi:hypothetical protein
MALPVSELLPSQKLLPMSLDHSVTYVPGLYPFRAATAKERQAAFFSSLLRRVFPESRTAQRLDVKFPAGRNGARRANPPGSRGL